MYIKKNGLQITSKVVFRYKSKLKKKYPHIYRIKEFILIDNKYYVKLIGFNNEFLKYISDEEIDINEIYSYNYRCKMN